MTEKAQSALQKKGHVWEDYCRKRLEKEGLVFVTKNYSCQFGEIDLIMKDKSSLVFVEVRYRQSDKFGSAVSTVTYAKQKKLINTANYFLQSREWARKMFCRFDVVGITPRFEKNGNKNEPKLEWIQNAFSS